MAKKKKAVKKRAKKKRAKIPAIGKIPDTGPATEVEPAECSHSGPCAYCGKEAISGQSPPCQCYKLADKGISQSLYTRCRKEIGMSDAQIASYSSEDALLQAANGMHPKSNVDARIKEGTPPKNIIFEENMPDSFTLESVLEAKFISTNRDHFDRGNLQAFLRRINRRYGPFEPVRIIQDRSFKVVKRELITKYTIFFKE